MGKRGLKVSAANERFLVVEQRSPEFYATNLKNILPLKWEVIDRGKDFVLWDESTVNERVIARFAHQEPAIQLVRILRGQE